MKNEGLVHKLDEIGKRIQEIELLVNDVRYVSSKEYELTILDDLPKKLKTLRKEQQITQQSLAMLAGVSIGLVSKIEDGDLNVSLGKLKNILDVFGVKICFK